MILLDLRCVGKTAFIKKYLSNIPKQDYLQLNGEDLDDVNLLKERSVNNYSRLLTNVKLLVIDEAQNSPDIGIICKHLNSNGMKTENQKFRQFSQKPIQKPVLRLLTKRIIWIL